MVAAADTETAVIVPVEAADPAVADHRRRLGGVGRGVLLLAGTDAPDAWHTVRVFPLSAPA